MFHLKIAEGIEAQITYDESADLFVGFLRHGDAPGVREGDAVHFQARSLDELRADALESLAFHREVVARDARHSVTGEPR